jgi:OCT family organic cation transporter-like MFS transporter 4/5
LQWDLVCDKDFYPTLALVLFGVSGFIGNWIFGYIQDRFFFFNLYSIIKKINKPSDIHATLNIYSMGRRPAFFIYLLIESVFAIGTAFTVNFSTWLACRIGVGFTIPGAVTITNH